MSSNNICIIGPTGSGKTTYLATLAYHAEHQLQNHQRSSYTITPQCPDARKLTQKAKLLLEKGGEIEPTKLGDEIQTVDDLPFYSFTIEQQFSNIQNIQAKFNWKPKIEKFQITTRDYPGEVFDFLAGLLPSLKDKDKQKLIEDCFQDFIEDCFTDKRGCVMMLPSWEAGSDSFYLSLLTEFVKKLESVGQKNNYKMAIVMSKCERGEIWPGRLEPEIDLFKVHLEDTTDYLRKTFIKQNLSFFALSTFGIMGRNDPRPNRIDLVRQGGEPGSVLRKSEKKEWQPYNLIEPLYWLMNS